jgi:hypothetical protein
MRKGISNHLRNAGDEMRREDAAEACSEMESDRWIFGWHEDVEAECSPLSCGGWAPSDMVVCVRIATEKGVLR